MWNCDRFLGAWLFYLCVTFWKIQLCIYTGLRQINYLCRQINKMITTVRSKDQSPRTPCLFPYHNLNWLVAAPVINKTTRSQQITKVSFPYSLLRKKLKLWTLFRCLPITFVQTLDMIFLCDSIVFCFWFYEIELKKLNKGAITIINKNIMSTVSFVIRKWSK